MLTFSHNSFNSFEALQESMSFRIRHFFRIARRNSRFLFVSLHLLRNSSTMLFQKTIVNKYKQALPKENTNQPWEAFQQYFLNKDIQQNILQSKEEQFQEGFLRELFVKVLGYTLNPSPDYNLITEKKNETNYKKADGAIQLDGKVIGVIELKDRKTTDLYGLTPEEREIVINQ